MLDSGTISFYLPSWSGMAPCTGAGAQSHFLCPERTKTITVSLRDMRSGNLEGITSEIGNYEQEVATGIQASNNIGQACSHDLSGYLLIGMPFFYGRTVYIGFDVNSTPLGTGPLIGFER